MAKKKTKKAKKRGRPKGSGKKKSTTVSASAAGLIKQLGDYQAELEQRSSEIQAELEAVSTAMNAMGSSTTTAPAKRGPGRPPKKTKGLSPRRGPRPQGGSLREVIHKVLSRSRKPMALKDISSSVVSAGYKTASKNLGNQVSMTLAKMVKSREAKKVGRGTYTA